MSRHLVWVIVVCIVAGAALFVFNPGNLLGTFTLTPSAIGVVKGDKVYNLIVENRKLVSGPATLEANVGDKVTINITVDETEELHLHGYDLHIDLEKGKQGSLSFTANASGRFPYELENSKTDVGALEVQP